jgi:RHS repeat-associated protein
MTQRVEGGSTYTQIFDAENRLISVTVNSQTTQFFYDGSGSMVKKILPDGSRTIYIGGVYEVKKNASGTVTGTTTYYPAAGAMRMSGSVYYILGDQLGSTSVVMDAGGVKKGEQRYYPFGETRSTTGTLYTDRLFTGQQEITGLGLYYYKARFYDPELGRFISADTVTPGGTQGLNRYSYANNSPINATDPTGHECVSWDGEKEQCTEHNDGYPTWNPIPSTKVTYENSNDPGALYKPDPYVTPKIPPLFTWKDARDFFGNIDPFELGPLTGSGQSFVNASQQIMESYIANCSACLQYPQLKGVVSSSITVFEGIAVGYDYSYDQITNTGPYSNLPGPSNLPSWSGLNTGQKILAGAFVVAIVGTFTLLIIPK